MFYSKFLPRNQAFNGSFMVLKHVAFIESKLDCYGRELHLGLAGVSLDKNVALCLVFYMVVDPGHEEVWIPFAYSA